MGNPFQSEQDAFRAALALAGIAGGAVLVGSLAGAGYGMATVAGGIALAGAVAAGRREAVRRASLREAAEAPHTVSTAPAHRILVVANESLGGPELRRELMERLELWPELYVVAPALCSRSHRWTSDCDEELDAARRRLAATLAWAAEQGFAARGEVGDADPLLALEDALRQFAPDEIVIATHPPELANWLESGLVERARAELDVPVTHVAVDAARGRVEIDRPLAFTR